MADPQKERQQYALQTIFSFFLGLMVLAFIGIGVNTFYPQPERFDSPEIQELFREQESIMRRGPEQMLPVDEERLEEIRREIEAAQADMEQARQVWARNTSIILILFATMVMGISLVRSEQLRVISNGLLLGGLFTMVYGVGWILFSDESVARFAVIVFALLVTLALGYLRFVRRTIVGTTGAAAIDIPGRAVDDSALASLSARIEALERRAAAAAAALGPASTDSEGDRDDG